MIPNFCTVDLPPVRDLYTQLFSLEVAFDSDWYVQLSDPASGIEIGFILSGHDMVPAQASGTFGGMYLTLVVDDVDDVLARVHAVKTADVTLISPPENTDYGQRRMVLGMPDGVVLDVSSLIKN